MQDDTQRPIRTLSYRLTRADALAYKQLKHELTGWERCRLLLLVACAGGTVGLLPDDMTPVAWWLAAASAILAFGALALVWSSVAERRSAAALPLPGGEVMLEQWGDRLVERSATGLRVIAFDAIAQTICTDAHVFVREGTVPVIVPRAAFGHHEDMQAFAETIDAASQRAQP